MCFSIKFMFFLQLTPRKSIFWTQITELVENSCRGWINKAWACSPVVGLLSELCLGVFSALTDSSPSPFALALGFLSLVGTCWEHHSLTPGRLLPLLWLRDGNWAGFSCVRPLGWKELNAVASTGMLPRFCRVRDAPSHLHPPLLPPPPHHLFGVMS